MWGAPSWSAGLQTQEAGQRAGPGVHKTTKLKKYMFCKQSHQANDEGYVKAASSKTEQKNLEQKSPRRAGLEGEALIPVLCLII